MTSCKICSLSILADGVECDGVCGHSFHASCLKRSTKITSAGFTTCSACSDIKPCHILRLVKRIADGLSNEQSIIADRVNVISANCAGLQLLSDDLGAFNEKLDKLLDAAAVISANSSDLLSKLHDVSGRLTGVSASVDDLCAAFADCDLSSGSEGSGPIFPVVNDIRRGVKQIKADLMSLSSTTSKNLDGISSIASDMKGFLSQHCGVESAPRLVKRTSTKRLSSRRRRRRRLAAEAVSTEQRRVAEPSPSRDSSTHAPLPSSRSVGASGPGSRASGIDILKDLGSQRPHAVDTDLVNPTNSSVMHSSSVDPPDVFDAVALRPAVLPRCVFISRVHPDTTSEDVVRYVSSRFNVSQDIITCRRIDRARDSAGSFSASFRVVVPDVLFHDVISSEIWPSGAIVREFVPRHRSRSQAASKNLLAKSVSTTQV